MSIPELVLALTALLFAPGPTNTLLAVFGAGLSLRRALPAVLPVLAGYLAVVTPLLLWGEAAAQALPGLRPALTALSALWVAVLALRLWRRPDRQEISAVIGTRALLITTLLNPKALVIGLVLLPQAATPALGLVLFMPLLLLASMTWLVIGATLRARHARTLRRGAAIWLALVSALMVARLLA